MLRVALLVVFAFFSVAAIAGAVPEYTLTIRDHHFVPAELAIPANTKVKLIVVNQDATAEEFESYELNREKIVAGNTSIVVWVGPLKPGRYPYFGDFHADIAKGALIVR